MGHRILVEQAVPLPLVYSAEVKQLSSISAAIARSSAETSKAIAAAVALARTEEITRLSSIGAAIARSSAETSKAIAAAAALARTEEITRLSSIGAAIARSSAETSKAIAAAAALARTEEITRLSSIGAAIARSMEAYKFPAVSDSVVRMVDAYRNSIASVSKASFEFRLGAKTLPRWSSSLFDESGAGFSRLSHLSHVLRSEEPFSPTVGKLIEDEFGDVNAPDLSDNAAERR